MLRMMGRESKDIYIKSMSEWNFLGKSLMGFGAVLFIMGLFLTLS